MTTRCFKDFYGCTATISETRGGRFKLHTSSGFTTFVKVYDTYRGARNAMSRMSDGWREVIPTEVV